MYFYKFANIVMFELYFVLWRIVMRLTKTVILNHRRDGLSKIITINRIVFVFKLLPKLGTGKLLNNNKDGFCFIFCVDFLC